MAFGRQNAPKSGQKWHPKTFDIALKFQRFRSRPTHDFIAIYNSFVGCNTSREMWKLTKNDLKTTSKMTSKSMQNQFKNRSKNRFRKITKKHAKSNKLDVKTAPRISRKIPEIAPEPPKEVPGDPSDPQRTPKAPHSRQNDVQRPKKVTQNTPKTPPKK